MFLALDRNSEFQKDRREFWQQWEERKKNENAPPKRCPYIIVSRVCCIWMSMNCTYFYLFRFRYTEAELAEMEAIE